MRCYFDVLSAMGVVWERGARVETVNSAIVLLVAALAGSAPVYAQEPAVDFEYVENLRECLNRAPACRYDRLSPDDQAKSLAADYHRNLSACVAGATAGCDRDKLSISDRSTLDASDYLRNLVSCFEGFPCKTGVLTPADREKLQESEYEANLVACIQNRLGCRPGDLIPDHRERQPEYDRKLLRCLQQSFDCRAGDLRPQDQRRVA